MPPIYGFTHGITQLRHLLCLRVVNMIRIKSAFRAGVPKTLREWLWRFRLRRKIRLAFSGTAPPAVVFSAQKTASTAVAEALRGAEGQPVFHIHFLDEGYMRTIGEALGWRELMSDEQSKDGFRSLGIAFTTALMREGRRLKVVSLVREPIARNISRYFENLDMLWNVKSAHERLDIGRLLAEFHQRFDHEEGLNWFDCEFSTMLGIDVYKHPFPRDKGFMKIDSGPYEVLIMRHDLDNRLKEKCVAELLGGATISIVARNVGAEKPYANVYREFVRRLKLPEEYVDHQLGSKYARHFYSADELARLRAKWLGGHGDVESEVVIWS